MNRHTVEPAVFRWNDQGTPVSQKFDDVYFSNQDGLAESRHVFLHGNGLPAHLRPIRARSFESRKPGLAPASIS